MTANTAEHNLVWKEGWRIWLILAALAVFIGLVYFSSIKELIRIWGVKEEYSYGYMIPFITAFLIWQRKDRLH